MKKGEYDGIWSGDGDTVILFDKKGKVNIKFRYMN